MKTYSPWISGTKKSKYINMYNKVVMYLHWRMCWRHIRSGRNISLTWSPATTVSQSWQRDWNQQVWHQYHVQRPGIKTNRMWNMMTKLLPVFLKEELEKITNHVLTEVLVLRPRISCYINPAILRRGDCYQSSDLSNVSGS